MKTALLHPRTAKKIYSWWGQEEGKIAIHLSTMDNCVEVSVADNGPGIPEADQPYIFERYRKSAKSHKKGTGLGLAIAKKIMDLHDTTLEVQSKLHEGTRFVFVLQAYGTT